VDGGSAACPADAVHLCAPAAARRPDVRAHRPLTRPPAPDWSPYVASVTRRRPSPPCTRGVHGRQGRAQPCALSVGEPTPRPPPPCARSVGNRLVASGCLLPVSADHGAPEHGGDRWDSSAGRLRRSPGRCAAVGGGTHSRLTGRLAAGVYTKCPRVEVVCGWSV